MSSAIIRSALRSSVRGANPIASSKRSFSSGASVEEEARPDGLFEVKEHH